jgi:hypothetical protein
VMELLSHAGDGAAEATLTVACCCCQVMLAMALPSLAGDVAAEVMLVMA